MNTTHYCKMIFDNLNDKNTFKEVANKCETREKKEVVSQWRKKFCS